MHGTLEKEWGASWTTPLTDHCLVQMVHADRSAGQSRLLSCVSLSFHGLGSLPGLAWTAFSEQDRKTGTQGAASRHPPAKADTPTVATKVHVFPGGTATTTDQEAYSNGTGSEATGHF